MARIQNTGEASTALLFNLKMINEEQLELTKKTTNYLSDISSSSKRIESALKPKKNLLKDILGFSTSSGNNAKLIKQKETPEKSDKGNSVKEEFKALGLMAGALSNLIKVAGEAKPKAAENIKNTLKSITDAITPVSGKVGDILKGTQGINLMAKGITSLGFSLAIATPLYSIGLPGLVIAGASIKILSMLFETINGEKVLEASAGITLMGISIITLGTSLAIFSATASGAAVLGVAASVLLLGITYSFIGGLAPEIQAAGIAISYIGLSITALAIGLLIYKATGVGVVDAFSASVSILVLGIAMGFVGVVAPLINRGSVAMSFVAIPIMLLSVSMLVFKATNTTLEDVGVLGLTLVTVGGIAAIAGVFAPLIIVGSVALLTVGVALIAVSYGLSMFKNVKWNVEDSKNLTYAFGSIRNAFMGGSGDSKDVLSAIGGFFLGAIDSAKMLVGASAMLLASGALIGVSFGLKEFKKVKWQEEDSKALTSVFASITKSFSIVTDKQLQKEHGINTSPLQLYAGVLALSQAGSTITSLAKGVKSFANLTFDDWEYDEKSGKMKITGRTKLSSGDIEMAGNNIAHVISVVGRAFAEVGKLEDGGGSNDPILKAIFTGGYVYKGVRSLSSAGSTIVSLAKGVREFANLSFTEYEIKDGKLTPKAIIKMTSADIETASLNISKVISVVGAAFAEVGKLNEGQSSNNSLLNSIFGGGGRYVKRGVEALRTSGSTIVSLGQGVRDFANMTITEYAVRDVDGVPTIVPIDVKKMTDGDIQKAGENIAKVISVVSNVFAEVGKLDEGQNSQFNLLNSIFGGGGRYVKRGVAALSGVGVNLNNIADAIPKYANLNFTKFEIKDIDGKPTLVPSEIIQLSDGDLQKAGENISKILSVVAKAFASVGEMNEKGSGWFVGGYVDKGVKALSGVGENLHGIVESTLKVASMQIPVYDNEGNITSYLTISDSDLIKAGDVIQRLLGSSAGTMAEFGKEYGEGSEKNKSLLSGLSVIGKVSSEYSNMVDALSSKSGEAETIASGVTTISGSMTSLVNSIFSSFDTTKDPLLNDKLNMLARFTGSISTLSNSSNGLVSTAESMGKIANSMKIFKENVNTMNPKNLGILDSLFNSFASLAKVSGGIDSMSRQLKMTIEESMGKLAEILNEMSGTSSAQLNATQTGNSFLQSGLEQTKQPKEIDVAVKEKATENAMSNMNAAALENLESVLRNILMEIQRGINANKR